MPYLQTPPIFEIEDYSPNIWTFGEHVKGPVRAITTFTGSQSDLSFNDICYRADPGVLQHVATAIRLER